MRAVAERSLGVAAGEGGRAAGVALSAVLMSPPPVLWVLRASMLHWRRSTGEESALLTAVESPVGFCGCRGPGHPSALGASLGDGSVESPSTVVEVRTPRLGLWPQGPEAGGSLWPHA